MTLLYATAALLVLAQVAAVDGLATPTLFFNGSVPPVGGVWTGTTGSFNLAVAPYVVYNSAGGFYSLNGTATSSSQGLQFVSSSTSTSTCFTNLGAAAQSATFEFFVRPNASCVKCVLFSAGGPYTGIGLVMSGTTLSFSQCYQYVVLGSFSYDVASVSNFLHIVLALDVTTGVTLFVNGLLVRSASYLTTTWDDASVDGCFCDSTSGEALGGPCSFDPTIVGGFPSTFSGVPLTGDFALFRFWKNDAFTAGDVFSLLLTGPCAVGQFGGWPGSSTCQACPSGYVAPSGSIICSPGCAAGWYASGTSCLACPLGQSSPANSSSSLACSSCVSGMFYTFSSACTLCPPGSYQPLPGQASCISCDENFYAPNSGGASNLTCIPCPTDTFSSPDVDGDGWWEDEAGSGANLLVGSGCARELTGSNFSATGYAWSVPANGGPFLSLVLGKATTPIEFVTAVPSAASSVATLEFWVKPASWPSLPPTTGRVLFASGGVCGFYDSGLTVVVFNTTVKVFYSGLVSSPSSCTLYELSYDMGPNWQEFRQISVAHGLSRGGVHLVVDGLEAESGSGTVQWLPYPYTYTACNADNDLGSKCNPSSPCLVPGSAARTCPDGLNTTGPFNGAISIFRYYQDFLSAPELLALYRETTGAAYCLPGTNPSNGSCVNCSAGTYMDTISSFILLQPCKPCARGYYSNPGASLCTQCAPGTYQPVTGQPSCPPVPPGSYQPSFGSFSYLACAPGQYSPAGWVGQTTPPCLLCQPGTWTSSSGTTNCTPCGVGFFNYRNGSSSIADCDICPKFGQISPVGASSVSQCVCPAGTVEDETQCQCPLGMFYAAGSGCSNCTSTTYKDFIGNSPCLACPAGATVPLSRIPAKNITDCSLCSVIGQVITASGCVCDAGYFYDAGTGGCFPCSGPAYKALAQNTLCTACPLHSNPTTFPATSISSCHCPFNSTMSSDETICNCDPGFEWSGASCTLCSTSSWKSAPGDGPCLACPTFGSVPDASRPAINSSFCQCPDHSKLSCGLCQCDEGYEGAIALSGLTCSPCGFSSYKDVPGNSACTPCPAYATVFGPPATNASNCSCPINALLIDGSCLCEEGFGATFNGAGLGCSPCPSSSFKNVTSNGQCTVCATYATVLFPPGTDASNCSCPLNSTLLTGSCQCDPGFSAYFAPNLLCVPCGSSSYKGSSGNSPCSPCPALASVASPPALTSVDCICPPLTVLQTNACVCDAGYFRNANGFCQACDATSYKTMPGDASALCLSCPPNTIVQTTPGTSLSSCVCSSAHFVPDGNGNCICDIGYTLNGTVCDPCSPSTFKGVPGIFACFACPVHALVPPARQPGLASSDCDCPTNSIRDSGDTYCLCDPGFEWTGAACTPCAATGFKSTQGDGPCISCPGSSVITGNNLPGTSSSQCSCPGTNQVPPNCDCNLGYYSNGATCVACDVSAYKDFVGDSACSPCPNHAGVPLAWQPGNSSSSCVCPTNSVLNRVNNRCDCNLGYYWDTVNSQCAGCPLSQYKSTLGDGPCLSCPTGAQVALGPGIALSNCTCANPGKVATAAACSCDAGWGASADGLTCSQCSSFFYKDTVSDSPCLPCPVLATVLSPSGTSLGSCVCPANSVLVVSSSGTGCLCNSGYGYDAGAPLNPCVPCGSVEWKSELGNFPCVKCPDNSVVLSQDGKGATSEDSCICINRFPRNGTCLPCIPGGNCESGALYAADGFWRPDPSYELFAQCLPPKACRGGSPDTNTTRFARTPDGCNVGYSAFMCSHCDDGYAWSGSACVTCTGPNIGLIIGICVLTIAFVVYVYWTVGSATTSKLAIFVNYLQLVAQSYVVSVVKVLPLVEFNWITVADATSSCIYPFSWWGLWLFTMMIPLILTAIVALFIVVRVVYRMIHRQFRHPERHCHDAPNKKPLPTNSAQAVVMLLLFNYLLIAKTCLAMFACVSIFDNVVLTSSYSFECGTELHAGLIALAVVWLVLFCVLLPAVILLRIVIPHRLPEFMRVLDFDFLTVHFRPRYKWWEIIFIARRLCFAVIVTIVSVIPSMKVLIFILFALSFLLAQAVCHPYIHVADNALEFAGLAVIVVTFSVQSYVLAYGDPNNAGLYFVVVLNGLMVACMVVFLLIDLIPMIVGKLRTAIDNSKRRKALKMAEAAEHAGTLDFVAMKRNSTILDDPFDNTIEHKEAPQNNAVEL